MARNNLIDVLRCLAIGLMVVFHLVFDLAYFYDYNLEYQQGFWDFWRRTCVSLFLIASGWTATLVNFSWWRTLKLLGASVLISLATYIILPTNYVRFGILHLLVSANLVYYIGLQRFNARQLLSLAALSYLAYWLVQPQQLLLADNTWLWLDLTSASYEAVDHYPLWPWLSLFLLGCALGKSYPQLKVRYFDKVPAVVTQTSRQSLTIYLVHQIVLMGLLSIVLGKPNLGG